MIELLPWGLSALTCLNIWLLGSKQRSGFLVGIGAQIPWLLFDYHVGAYGLMPLAIILGWLYLRGWRNWSDEAD